MSVGPLEIVIVLVLALLVFGPKQLPQAGRSLGQALREFRKATQTARTELGLDEVIDGINDVKSSVSLSIKDSGVTDVMSDLKASTTIDLNSVTAAAPRADVAAAAAASVVAPAADKPVLVAAEGADTTPLESADTTPAEVAGADVTAAHSSGRDDA